MTEQLSSLACGLNNWLCVISQDIITRNDYMTASLQEVSFPKLQIHVSYTDTPHGNYLGKWDSLDKDYITGRFIY